MKKKHNKLKIILISICSLILLLIILFCINYFVLLSPKRIINNLTNTLFNKTNNIIEKLSIDDIKTVTDKGSIKIETNIEKYNNLNEYGISYDIEYNREKPTLYLDTTIGDESENIEGKLYYEDNNIYFDFPFVISNIIKDTYEVNNKYDYLRTYNYKKVVFISNIIKESLVNVKNNNLKRKIEGFGTKTTYNIDKNEFKYLLDNISNNIKNNENATKIISNNKADEIYNYLLKKYKNIDIVIYNDFFGNLKEIEIITDNYRFEYLLNELNIYLINDRIFNMKFTNNKVTTDMLFRKVKISLNLNIEFGYNEFNFDGFIKVNMKNNEYVNFEISNSILTNEEVQTMDVTLAKSMNQFTKKDLKNIKNVTELIENALSIFNKE